MTVPDDAIGPEEPWEAEIGALLGAMPAVDPPDGFLAAAVNHRPLHAGRIMAGLLVATAAAVAIALGLSSPSLVVPELDAMTQRHLAAQTDLPSPDGAVDADGEPAASELTADFLAARLADFEKVAVVDDDRPGHTVYRDQDGDAFSVFVQPGAVDWDGLERGVLTEIGGTRVWLDDERTATIVQVGGETVTIVGFPTDEIERLIADVPVDSRSLTDRATELASTIVSQLGLPSD